MAFSLKKIGRAVNKLGVKTLRRAAPVAQAIPGWGMVAGTVANATFAAIDAKKAKKAQNKADEAYAIKQKKIARAYMTDAQVLAESGNVGRSGWMDSISSLFAMSGPNPPKTDNELANQEGVGYQAFIGDKKKIVLLIGALVIGVALLFIVRRRR